GYPFYSSYKNVEVNLLGGVVAINGVRPWYEYFSLAWRNLGWPLVSLFAATAALAIPTRFARLQTRDIVILLPAAVFAIAHMLIGHKETRFLLPAFPALFYLFAVSLD